jgi:multisubunit Na+/H+ antiporter MnhC subunit
LFLLLTGGVIYIRWGRKDCPILNGTQLVYSGMIMYLIMKGKFKQSTIPPISKKDEQSPLPSNH